MNVEIGNHVRYIGKLENAFDDITKELMENYLIIGNTYIIARKGFYEGDNNKPYYVFTFRHIYFPVDSFIKVEEKEIIRDQYNLK